MCELTLEAAGLNHLRYKQGDRVMHGQYEAVIVRHYYEDMWEIRVPGGVICVGASTFTRITAPGDFL